MLDCLLYCICYQTQEINSGHNIEYKKRGECNHICHHNGECNTLVSHE